MKPVVIVVIALVLVGGGSVAFFVLSNSGGEEGAKSTISGDQAKIPQDVLEKRGPRGSDQRLRDGAKQIETREDARSAALLSLERVEKELAATTDKDETEKLQRKKKLIEATLEKLEK